MTAAERLRLGLILLGICAGAVSADESGSGVSAGEWLERMNRALRTLDYEGRFVFQTGDHLEALYISHTMNDGKAHERLLSLNGSNRAVMRDEESVTCTRAKQEQVNVDRGETGRSFAPLMPISADALAEHYRFELGERSRVAGRATQDLEIHPLDEWRYGYRLSLDQQHALPLRTVVVDASGQQVSQIMFTDLQVGNRNPQDPSVVVPPSESDPAGAVPPEVSRSQWMQPPRWAFPEPPRGFELNLHRRHLMERGTEVEHFIFSDGLATVSVYVEPDHADGLRGMTHIGPVSAFGRVVDGHQVTAVGEVPAITVQRFGEAIVQVDH
jgi:sigma-E factor negative regulatory protein RseB